MSINTNLDRRREMVRVLRIDMNMVSNLNGGSWEVSCIARRSLWDPMGRHRRRNLRQTRSRFIQPRHRKRYRGPSKTPLSLPNREWNLRSKSLLRYLPRYLPDSRACLAPLSALWNRFVSKRGGNAKSRTLALVHREPGARSVAYGSPASTTDGNSLCRKN
jgi:hypothetical protein